MRQPEHQGTPTIAGTPESAETQLAKGMVTLEGTPAVHHYLTVSLHNPAIS